MQRNTYTGKYCQKRTRRRYACRWLYVVNILLLTVAAVRIFSAAGKPEGTGGMFMEAWATTVEAAQPEAAPIQDREAPEILGLRDILAYEGETVSYRSGITVRDNVDSEPELDVDSRRVDLSRSGTYTITYTARDAAGNETRAEASVTVLPREEGYVDMEQVLASVDAALGVIITPEMTVQQQVEAIYNWCRKSCRYAGHSERVDWHQAAYTMLTTGSGDCYGFYAVSKLMFERLEIPNIDVVKVKNSDTDSEHFWSMVSVDGGETYYHFDATPRAGQITQLCLVTDEVLDTFSQRNKGSHNRDTSLYPTTPED